MYGVGQKPSKSNPDKGHGGAQSGSMGGNQYRGNDYEAMYQKVEASDARKLKADAKSKI